MVRVRFAPSPTGNLHIGTLRAALFNWLYAKANNGTFILRIEDTDMERSKPEFETNIFEGLQWLGLTPDEGPLEGGDCGPYRQSERIEKRIYTDIAEYLVQIGKAYYCFLTDEDIQQEKESAKKAGIPYVHSRRSSEMTEAEVKANLEAGKPHAIRFKMTEDKVISFKDLVRDPIEFDCSLLSDFVLIKSDGSPSYNFAVVIDDAQMKITHVIRGEDHISNMPRQLALYEALGYDIPEFAHLPMILGPDKSKLSKRHGATAVTEYRDRGFLAESFMNYLALLGWSPKTEQELLSAKQLVDQFGLDRVNKSGAVFDIKKLVWMNGQYLRRDTAEAFSDRVRPFLNSDLAKRLAELDVEKQTLALFSVIDNLDVLSDINKYIDVYLEDEADYAKRAETVTFNDDQKNVLKLFLMKVSVTAPKQPGEFSSCLDQVCSELNVGKGKVFKPVRLAVTAQPSGPFISDVLSFFGLESIQQRIEPYLS